MKHYQRASYLGGMLPAYFYTETNLCNNRLSVVGLLKTKNVNIVWNWEIVRKNEEGIIFEPETTITTSIEKILKSWLRMQRIRQRNYFLLVFSVNVHNITISRILFTKFAASKPETTSGCSNFSSTTVSLSRALLSAVRRGYFPSLQKEPLKSSESRDHAMKPP